MKPRPRATQNFAGRATPGRNRTSGAPPRVIHDKRSVLLLKHLASDTMEPDLSPTGTNMDEEQAFELIDQLSFFDGFTQEEKRFLSTLENQIYKYFPSDVIIKEGDRDYSFFILLKGVVAIVKDTPKQVTITKLKAGALFGEIAYVAKRKRTTSVIADGDVIALKISTQNIDSLKLSIPTKLKDNLIKILVNRPEAMNTQMTRNV